MADMRWAKTGQNWVPVSGADPLPVTTVGGATTTTKTVRGFQQITALGASTALTVPANATEALIQAEAQVVRWRPDGATTAPTAAVGMRLAAGDSIYYVGDLAAIRFIEEAAGAKLNVSYFS